MRLIGAKGNTLHQQAFSPKNQKLLSTFDKSRQHCIIYAAAAKFATVYWLTPLRGPASFSLLVQSYLNWLEMMQIGAF